MPHNLTIEERLRATQERAAVLYRHLLARAVDNVDDQQYSTLDIDAFRGLAMIGEALYDDVHAISEALRLGNERALAPPAQLGGASDGSPSARRTARRSRPSSSSAA